MNMIQNNSISKKGKLDNDLLSDLPLSIIHIIQALLPIRDAVRTSILSTEWRYTWTTLPQLVFNNECADKEEEFEKFITRVLFRHRGPIHKFRLDCSGDFANVDEWIFCLARNGIQELSLDLYDGDSSVEIKSSLYSCKKLTYLSMYKCQFDPPPLTFKGFLFLKNLCLDTVKLSPDELYSLVSVCPVLENFELLRWKGSELKISAPNLKYMQLTCHHVKICIDAPLMTVISVDLFNYNNFATDQERKSAACDFANCLAGYTDLQELIGGMDFTMFLSFGIELCHRPLVFHHLELLDLSDVSFEDVKEIMVVANLIIGARNLQELKISTFCHNREDDESYSISYREFGFAPSFRLEKLRDVSLHVDGVGTAMGVEFLKFLLESSPVLEKMSFKVTDNTLEKQIKLLAKLIRFSCASPILKLCEINI